MTETDQKLLETIKAVTAKGNKAEIEQGRDGYKVLEVEKKVVWKEKAEA